LTAKRLGYASLILLACLTILSIQPWFEVELVSGSELRVEGTAAYPVIAASIFVDALAIALFLYLKSRWGAVLLVAGASAVIWSLVPIITVLAGSDSAVLEPFIANSTGIANWASQLDQVVRSHQTSFSALAAVILAFGIALLQGCTAVLAARNRSTGMQKRFDDRPGHAQLSNGNATEDDHSLWHETNPNHN